MTTHPGCQWNPQLKRASLPKDVHFNTTIARRRITTKDDGAWDLCTGCASLEPFESFYKLIINTNYHANGNPKHVETK
jgi:hypothetical protein